MSDILPRCKIRPLPDHQVAFLIDGRERLRWHFGSQYPRPFFYPFLGPSGEPLTRMGHPGAPNHDHHRSIWFAHRMVLGIDFWSDQTQARIRQQQWLAYEDGDEEAVMAVRLGWYDGHNPRELLQQELVAAVRPLDRGETLLELQATFRPIADVLEFGQTNFGFLAVRVAKSISEHFGAGQLTNSEGATGEPAIFGKTARWVDYSGPVQADCIEGVTYFDHPSNPGFPSHWHVRSDGWMGASVCMTGPVPTRRERPLTLRYLLHAHRGPINADRAANVAVEFAKSAPFIIEKSRKKHSHFVVRRL
ncbi:MAG: hypothetical protein GXP27_09080 [Planctomycetes bacterium]|nr:hypothetical protein [Planctomycetota bacterium]